MGTYGDFTQPFRGFSASQDCSVGSWSDHGAEGKAFEENQKRAKKALIASEASFQRIYDRFVAGDHPYRRRVVPLDRARTTERPDDYKIRFALPPLLRPSEGAFTLHLYLLEGVPEAHRELALAGFILCQPYRTLFQVGPASTRPIADEFERLFSGWGWKESCLAFPAALSMAYSREAEVRELARGSSAASANAALLLSAMEGLPIPAAVIARVDVGILIRFAPDAQWAQIREHAMRTMGDLEGRDSVVREWWAPLFA
jgi:hypothetical protein